MIKRVLLFSIFFCVILLESFTQCVPSISSNPVNSTGCEPFTIQFFDNSSCVIQSRLWNFGDGTTSSVQNPTKTFPAGVLGDTTYSVSLSLQDLNGNWFSTNRQVNVFKAPKVSFTMDKLTVCAIVDSVRFINTSPTPPGTVFSWDFTDGSSLNNEISPYHTFNNPGTYEVRLTVTNINGCSQTVTNSITVNEIPNPNFSRDIVVGCNPVDIKFTNITQPGTFPITDWEWDFGGFDTSTVETPPAIKFKDPGIFLVGLAATNTAGCTNKTTINILINKTPLPDFTMPKSLCLNDSLTLTYTGDALNTATFEWTFDDAVILNGSNEGPYQLKWTTDSLKTVSLKVTEFNCTAEQSNSVNVLPLIQVSLITSSLNDSICEEQPITFTAIPEFLRNYEFFDRGVPVQNSPLNEYIQQNLNPLNEVTVLATDTNGCNSSMSASKSVTVLPKPIVFLTMEPDSVCQGQELRFIATPGYDTYDFLNSFQTLQKDERNIFATDSIDDGRQITVRATQYGCSGELSNPEIARVIEPLLRPILNCGTSTETSVEFIWNDDEKVLGYQINIENGGFQNSFNRNNFNVTGLNFGDTVWAQVVGLGAQPCGNTPLSDSIFCVAKLCDPITYTPSPNKTICEGDSVMLTLTNIQTPSMKYSLAWSGGGYQDEIDYSIVLRKSSEVRVLLQDSSQLGCPPTQHIFDIKVNPLPKAKLQDFTRQICEGIEYDISAAFPGYQNYVFWLNDTLKQSSNFHVFTYQDYGPGLNVLRLDVTEKACKASDTLELEVINKKNITLLAEQDSVCTGGPITFIVPDIYFYYRFVNNATDEVLLDSTLNTYTTLTVTDLYVIATDEFGCETFAATKAVFQKEIPSVTISSNITSSPVCATDNIVFTALPSGLEKYEFWESFDTLQLGVSNVLNKGNVIEDRFYYVRAMKNGCWGPFSDSISYKTTDPLQTPVANCGVTGDEKMEFTWDSIPFALGYNVSVSGNPLIIPSSGVNGLEHVIGGLQALDTICITVTALGSAPCGNSIPSNSVCCIMPCGEVKYDLNQPFREVCSGELVTLRIFNIETPSGSFVTKWENGEVARDLSKTFIPTKDTTVQIAVWDTTQSRCTPTTKYFVIKVKPIPFVSLNIDTSVCSNDTILLSASIRNYDNYEFFERLKSLNSGPSPDFLLTKPIHRRYYSVKTTLNGCTYQSDSVVINVAEALAKPDLNCGLTTTNSITFTWDTVPNANGYEISINGFPFITPSSGFDGFSHLRTNLRSGDSLYAVIRAIGSEPCTLSEMSDRVTCYAINCEPLNFDITRRFDICEGEERTVRVFNVETPSNRYALSWDGGNSYSKTLSFTAKYFKDTAVFAQLIDSTQLQCPSVRKASRIKVIETPRFNLLSNAQNDSVCQGEILELRSDVIGFDSYRFFINNELVQDSIYFRYSTLGLQPGYHTVRVESSNFQCSYIADSTDFYVVGFPQLNLISSDDNDTICRGTPLTFTANTGFDRYDFYLNNTLVQSGIQTSYFIADIPDLTPLRLVTNNRNLCFRNSDTIVTKVWEIPDFKLSTNPSATTICDGQNVVFTITPPSNWFVLYNNEDSIIRLNGNAFAIDSIKNTDKFYILGSLNNCTDLSDTIIKNVEFTPTVSVNVDTFAICIGGSTTITANGGDRYVWSTSPTLEVIQNSITLRPTVSTQFWVQSKVGNCFSERAFINSFVDTDIPFANAGMPKEICRFDTVQLIGDGGVSYRWLGENIINPNVFNPLVHPVVPTRYALEVTNIVCKDTSYVDVNVDRCLSELPNKIPQIITPNNDGKNDKLIINDIDYFKNNSITIYNRWSTEVYNSSPYLNDWQGTTNNGRLLPDGTYFYVVKLGDKGLVYTGYVMIKRE